MTMPHTVLCTHGHHALCMAELRTLCQHLHSKCTGSLNCGASHHLCNLQSNNQWFNACCDAGEYKIIKAQFERMKIKYCPLAKLYTVCSDRKKLQCVLLRMIYGWSRDKFTSLWDAMENFQMKWLRRVWCRHLQLHGMSVYGSVRGGTEPTSWLFEYCTAVRVPIQTYCTFRQ